MGSKDEKVKKLVAENNYQMAFKTKGNLQTFIEEWNKKGYIVEIFPSSGVTIEDEKNRTLNAYYAIARQARQVDEKQAPVSVMTKNWETMSWRKYGQQLYGTSKRVNNKRKRGVGKGSKQANWG